MTNPLPAELAVEAEPFDDLVLTYALESDEANVPEVRAWKIDRDELAEWAARKLAAAAEAEALIAEQAVAWRARINAWQEEQAKRPLAVMAFFEGHLKDYARRVREASGDEIKTLKLPSVTVRTRGTSSQVVVDDEAAFMDFARTLPAPVLDRIAPRRISTSALRHETVVEEVPTGFLLTCGHDGPMPEGGFVIAGTLDERNPIPARADGVICPACAEPVLIANYTATKLAAGFPATSERPGYLDVPGLTVESPEVTASVQIVRPEVEA